MAISLAIRLKSGYKMIHTFICDISCCTGFIQILSLSLEYTYGINLS